MLLWENCIREIHEEAVQIREIFSVHGEIEVNALK
jgi:hypothetical protein